MADFDPTPADPESQISEVSLRQSYGVFDLSTIESLEVSDRDNISFTPIPFQDDHIEGTIPTKGSREIKISSWFHNASFAALRGSVDHMQTNLLKGKKDFGQYSDRIIPAHIRSITKKYTKNSLIVGYDIGLVAEEPFAQSLNLTKTAALTNGATFSVHNPGDVAFSSVIKFFPVGVTATFISLKNTTDSNAVLAYNRNVTLGNVLTIDAEEKTVDNQGNNGILNFSGDWLEMLVGTNHFSYVGSTVNIEFNMNHRYFF